MLVASRFANLEASEAPPKRKSFKRVAEIASIELGAQLLIRRDLETRSERHSVERDLYRA